MQSTKQWDGNFLPHYPTSNAEITVLRITIPAGVTLPSHTHPVISAGVILQGTLQLTLQDGTTRLFNQGAALIETVNTVHTGKSLGPKDTVVLVFYAGSKHLPRTVQVKTKAL
ncbi:cupin domain-containing protein [Prochlorococcus marinus]|uniref:cupin domain-containing protein n=1 Tax=Prochlorococcus TaxID=1218 RepID=UPI001F492AF8|nr:cupin domain-containing protein [Prochlorococcus marinus]